MSMIADIMGAAGALQGRVHDARDYFNPPAAAAPPQGEDSWLVSMTETAGQVAGMSVAGITGACVGLGTHLASNYSKLDDKAIKAIKSSGEIVGLLSTALIGVVAGIGIDHLLNSQGAVIWALAISGLSHYLLSSYAKSAGKVLLISTLRIKGLVFETLAGGCKNAVNWGAKGADIGGKVGRVLGQVPSAFGSRKADELLGANNKTFFGATSMTHLAAHFLVKRVSGVALLAIASYIIDSCIMNIGLTEVLMLSFKIEVLRNVIQPGIDSAGLQGEMANRVKNLVTASLVMGAYGTGAVEGGWTGSLIRGGWSTFSMALNLAWNNASLIQQASLFCARFISAIAIGYAGLVVESPILIFPSIVVGALIARLFSGETKDSAAPVVAAPVVAQPVADPVDSDDDSDYEDAIEA